MAESWARGRGQRTEPFLTLDALRMSKKRMFFSHEKAARHLGYRPRPAVAGFSDALDWFKERGYLS
jgi:dihydroflavonol-4-reductase